jgi:hypothetical protein
MAAVMTETVTCPLDGTVLTRETTETRQDDFASYVVVTDPGTVHSHIRDEHPERWQEMCDFQRKWNALGRGMPRRVDGCFLAAGEDVGYTPGGTSAT